MATDAMSRSSEPAEIPFFRQRWPSLAAAIQRLSGVGSRGVVWNCACKGGISSSVAWRKTSKAIGSASTASEDRMYGLEEEPNRPDKYSNVRIS